MTTTEYYGATTTNNESGRSSTVGDGNDAGPPQSLAELHKLTSIDSIRHELRLLQTQETMVDSTLDSILKLQPQLSSTLSSLDTLRPQIGVLQNVSTSLSDILSSTSHIAERISSKVRQLDIEQSRVKDVIRVVEEVQEIRKSAVSVERALKEGDWEFAAACVGKAIDVDSGVEAVFSDEDTVLGPAGDDGSNPLEILRKARQQLIDIAMSGFDDAVQQNNQDLLLRFFKLFPQVKCHDIGLDKFAAYVCGSLSRKCQDLRRELGTGKEKGKLPSASILTTLFEMTAMIVDRQEALVDSVYGMGSMLRVIQRLQREVDIQSSIVLGSFNERNQLERKLADISRHSKFSSPTATTAPEDLDSLPEPREIDNILSEIAVLSQKTRIFNNFIHVRAGAEVGKLQQSGQEDLHMTDSGGDGLVKTSKLDELIQKLVNDYVLMEEYFIRRSIEKAISLDSHIPPDLTSSSVDDIFYILKTCTTRAVSTADADAVCAIVNGIGRVLEVDWVGWVQKRMVAGSDGKTFVALNNLSLTHTYILALVETLNAQVQQAFAGSEHDLMKIQACLGVLAEYGDNFLTMLRTWLKNVFTQQVQPRVRTILAQAYNEIKYTPTEEEYSLLSPTPLFASRMCTAIQKVISAFQTSMTDENYTFLLRLVVEYLAKDIERHVLTKQKVNALGALLLDADVRYITSFFVGLGNGNNNGVRDLFARLAMVTMLLNVETVEEVKELRTRMRGEDVKKVLSVRAEFASEDIQKLEI
ncbi:COG4 transport protein-domain-containing protein [Gaertneriomyces semiglobifer]|nr:COG4 transport protein-domain-containing protein [Gaertneriomyces semiglobifer]